MVSDRFYAMVQVGNRGRISKYDFWLSLSIAMHPMRSQGYRLLIVLLTLLACLFCGSVNAAPGGVSEGLRVWLRADTGISVADGSEVMVWADQSGNGNDAVFNPANPFGELPPIYDASHPDANGRASVRFNDENALELDLTWLAGSDYTIFVVNGRDRFGVANFYIAGDTFAQDQNLVLGYENPELLRFSHLIRDLDVIVEPYEGVPLWAVDTFRFSTQFGKEIYRDGVIYATRFQFEPLMANTGSTLGHFRAFGTQFWFEGDLAEVIIYDRKLTLDEQSRVEAELADLYDRPMNVRDFHSKWTTNPPTIDGSAFDPEWNQVDPINIPFATVSLGAVKIMNDDEFLYVLLDVTLDTFDDPPVSPLNGDYFNFSFDVNENATIDPNVDLNYGFLDSGRSVPCRQFFLGPNLFTGCFGTESQIGWQFTGSPLEPVSHHVLEYAFSLSEIEAVPGDIVRSAFIIRSNTPQFAYAAPPNLFASLADYFEIALESEPAEQILKDGFEDSP